MGTVLGLVGCVAISLYVRQHQSAGRAAAFPSSERDGTPQRNSVPFEYVPALDGPQGSDAFAISEVDTAHEDNDPYEL